MTCNKCGSSRIEGPRAYDDYDDLVAPHMYYSRYRTAAPGGCLDCLLQENRRLYALLEEARNNGQLNALQKRYDDQAAAQKKVYEDEISRLKKEISDLNTRLDKVLGKPAPAEDPGMGTRFSLLEVD